MLCSSAFARASASRAFRSRISSQALPIAYAWKPAYADPPATPDTHPNEIQKTAASNTLCAAIQVQTTRGAKACGSSLATMVSVMLARYFISPTDVSTIVNPAAVSAAMWGPTLDDRAPSESGRRYRAYVAPNIRNAPDQASARVPCRWPARMSTNAGAAIASQPMYPASL